MFVFAWTGKHVLFSFLVKGLKQSLEGTNWICLSRPAGSVFELSEDCWILPVISYNRIAIWKSHLKSKYEMKA